MLHFKSAISKAVPSLKAITQTSTRGFAGLGSKRKPARRDLEKYDIVIVGGNLGAILSRHIDDDSHGKYNVMVVLEDNTNQQWSMRTVYEQQRASKSDYFINAKLAINMYTASEVTSVDKYLPEENAVLLRNGRRIGYERLVIATGLKEDFNAVPGLEDAWADVDHPVFVPKDHPSWKSFQHPYPRWHYNFTGGDAFFCIPPFPYKGEVSSLNFLISDQIWKWHLSHGKLSPKHSFTIVNANDNFCKYFDPADQVIKDKIQKHGIKVEYGWNLKSVDKTKHTAVFENVATGEKQTRTYGQVYSVIPCKPDDALVSAGLASEASEGMLDVDHQTLRHNKYNNIFGLGDVNNLPTTKSFWGGFHQIHVVRNNVQRSLKGQSLNGLYSGYSKVPIYLGQNSMTFAAHYYDQKPTWTNLIDSYGGPIANMRYYYWAKSTRKDFMNWYLKKSWGPPTFKLKRTFRELPADKEANEKSQSKSLFQALDRTLGKSAPEVATQGAGAHVAADVNTFDPVKSVKETVEDAAVNAKEAATDAAKNLRGNLGQQTGSVAKNLGAEAGQNVADSDRANPDGAKQGKPSSK